MPREEGCSTKTLHCHVETKKHTQNDAFHRLNLIGQNDAFHRLNLIGQNDAFHRLNLIGRSSGYQQRSLRLWI